MTLKSSIRIALLLAVLFTGITELHAQKPYKIAISGGLYTKEIIGNNFARNIIYEADPDKEEIIGGGYFGPQSGFSVNANISLTEDGIFKIPISFEYSFFRAGQTIVPSTYVWQRLRHETDLTTFSLGCNYSFFHIPLAQARLYTGVNARLNYIHSDNFYLIDDYQDPTRPDILKQQENKSDVLRLGGELLLGIEGYIYDDIYLNINVGYEVLNLLGRDDERGELLTVTHYKYIEKENFINLYNFRFMVQYALN